MKRDCGEGELIPTSWVVVSCPGKSDREIEHKCDTRELAQAKFDELFDRLAPYGDVRLYAQDKQRYMNCILSAFCNPQGEKRIATDRRNEI